MSAARLKLAIVGKKSDNEVKSSVVKDIIRTDRLMICHATWLEKDLYIILSVSQNIALCHNANMVHKCILVPRLTVRAQIRRVSE